MRDATLFQAAITIRRQDVQDARIEYLGVGLLHDLLADRQLLPHRLKCSAVAIGLFARADNPLPIRVDVTQHVTAKQRLAKPHRSRVAIDFERLIRFFIEQTHDQDDIMIRLPVVELLLGIVRIIFGLIRVFELLVLLLLLLVELLLRLFFGDLLGDREFERFGFGEIVRRQAIVLSLDPKLDLVASFQLERLKRKVMLHADFLLSTVKERLVNDVVFRTRDL